VIQRVSQPVGDHGEIAETDVNPWLTFPDGGVAVDGRVLLRQPWAVCEIPT